jgi:hypothetical protein
MIGGTIVTGRRRRRRKQPHDVKETRGYCKLKVEALYSTVRRTGLGKRLWTHVRETVE